MVSPCLEDQRKSAAPVPGEVAGFGLASGRFRPVPGIATPPKGARVVSTATAGDRIMVTVEIAGATEIRTFDADTLHKTGRLRFATQS